MAKIINFNELSISISWTSGAKQAVDSIIDPIVLGFEIEKFLNRKFDKLSPEANELLIKQYIRVELYKDEEKMVGMIIALDQSKKMSVTSKAPFDQKQTDNFIIRLLKKLQDLLITYYDYKLKITTPLEKTTHEHLQTEEKNLEENLKYHEEIEEKCKEKVERTTWVMIRNGLDIRGNWFSFDFIYDDERISIDESNIAARDYLVDSLSRFKWSTRLLKELHGNFIPIKTTIVTGEEESFIYSVSGINETYQIHKDASKSERDNFIRAFMYGVVWNIGKIKNTTSMR